MSRRLRTTPASAGTRSTPRANAKSCGIALERALCDSDQTSVGRRLAGAARGRRRAALEREHAVRSRVMRGASTANGTIDSTRRTTALTERQVAEQLGLSVATLRAWRHRGKGPRFLRLGRSVRYLPADVDEFVRASAVDTQSDSSSDEDSELGELSV